MMKAVIALALILPLSAFAGDKGDQGPKGPMGKRMDHMAQELELTDTQREQINTIFRTHHEKMMALREETEKEVNKVLTPEQQAKMDQMKEKRKKEWKEKKGKWKEHHGED